MESEAIRRSRGPRSAPRLRLTEPSKGMPKRTIRASGREARQAMKRGNATINGDSRAGLLHDVVVGQERHGGQRAARALDPMLGAEDPEIADALATDPEGLLQHVDDHPLG